LHILDEHPWNIIYAFHGFKSHSMGFNFILIIKIEHKHKIWVWNFSNYSQYAIPKTFFRLYWKSSSQALKSYQMHFKENKKDKGLSLLLKFGSLWKLGSFHIWGRILGRKRMDFRHWAALSSLKSLSNGPLDLVSWPRSWLVWHLVTIQFCVVPWWSP